MNRLFIFGFVHYKQVGEIDAPLFDHLSISGAQNQVQIGYSGEATGRYRERAISTRFVLISPSPTALSSADTPTSQRRR